MPVRRARYDACYIQGREEGDEGCKGGGGEEKRREEGSRAGRWERIESLKMRGRVWACVARVTTLGCPGPPAVRHPVRPSVFRRARARTYARIRTVERSPITHTRGALFRRSKCHTHGSRSRFACLFRDEGPGTRAFLSLQLRTTLNEEIIGKIQPHRSDNNDNSDFIGCIRMSTIQWECYVTHAMRGKSNAMSAAEMLNGASPFIYKSLSFLTRTHGPWNISYIMFASLHFSSLSWIQLCNLNFYVTWIFTTECRKNKSLSMRYK